MSPHFGKTIAKFGNHRSFPSLDVSSRQQRLPQYGKIKYIRKYNFVHIMWHYISAAKYLDHFLFLMNMIQSGPECILAFVIGTTVKLVFGFILQRGKWFVNCKALVEKYKISD